MVLVWFMSLVTDVWRFSVSTWTGTVDRLLYCKFSLTLRTLLIQMCDYSELLRFCHALKMWQRESKQKLVREGLSWSARSRMLGQQHPPFWIASPKPRKHLETSEKFTIKCLSISIVAHKKTVQIWTLTDEKTLTWVRTKINVWPDWAPSDAVGSWDSVPEELWTTPELVDCRIARRHLDRNHREDGMLQRVNEERFCVWSVRHRCRPAPAMVERRKITNLQCRCNLELNSCGREVLLRRFWNRGIFTDVALSRQHSSRFNFMFCFGYTNCCAVIGCQRVGRLAFSPS